jgi:ethanolamine-phosphate cytidylyltransferase
MTTPRQRLDDAVKIINTFLKEKDIPPSTAIAAAVAGVTTLVGASVYLYPETFLGIRRGSFSMGIAGMLQRHAARRRARKPIRVYMDGCFDLTHFGHANALRQAKACGDVLVVGLVPDAEIRRCKGPPVLNDAERLAVVESCKWVDEMILDVPYDINEQFMNELWHKHKIDYIVHGDDPCLLPDGSDAYAAPKREGRFKTIKRTEGVSTTDIVGRMLSASKAAENDLAKTPGSKSPFKKSKKSAVVEDVAEPAKKEHFCTTSRRVLQFSEGGKKPSDEDVVVYVHGAFDTFHAGHVDLLKSARALGTFVIVGVHDDAAVSSYAGAHYPILNVNERSLGVMACRHADEVIIGAPEVVTRDLLATFNVAFVVAEDSAARSPNVGDGSASGAGTKSPPRSPTKSKAPAPAPPADPNAVPRALGIFREIKRGDGPGADITTKEIVSRIVENRAAFEERNKRKGASEAKYYELKNAGEIESATEE